MPAAVLWDFDGTIIDTEPLWMKAEVEFVTSHGGDWTEDDSRAFVGASWQDSGGAMYRRIAANGETDLDPWKVYRGIAQVVINILAAGQGQVRPGVYQLLDDLESAGIPSAVVSSSIDEMINAGIGSLERDNPFEVVISGPMMPRGKPEPDGYLMAAERLGVDPRDCIVLEDSPTGCLSGQRAGALVIGIPSIVELPPVDGQLRCDSLEELSATKLAQLLAQSR